MTENSLPSSSNPRPDRGDATPGQSFQPPAGLGQTVAEQRSVPEPVTPSVPPRPVRATFVLPAQTPYVTYAIMGITVLVFLAQQGTLLLLGEDLPAFFGVKSNALIAQGQLWRLLTPMLLHGGVVHILFNMYALRALGPGLERQYGHVRFLLLYGLAGFAGNVASFALTSSDSLGASTALFGLFGAEGVFLFHNRELFGERARAALNQIVTLAVINLLFGLSVRQIDNWGHIGGLAGGVLFAWFAGPLLKLEGIAPSYSIRDRRAPIRVWLAALGVGMLFAIIAVGVIFLRLA